MGIDIQSQNLMVRLGKRKNKPLYLSTVEEVRANSIKEYCSNQTLVPIGEVKDVFVPCPWGNLRIRLYYPPNATADTLLPIVMFYHGGGWTINTVETHDEVLHILCQRSGCIFASVDYRLAPEARFPSGLEDAYTGLQWVYDNAKAIGADPWRIGVCGDSSGGNFAAVLCQMARDRHGVPIQQQVLIYPNTDYVMAGWASATDVGTGYYCTKDALLWYCGHYVDGAFDLDNPYLCPYRAKSLAGLPPAYVVTATYDPLHDEGEAYAKRLSQEGCQVVYQNCDELMHGYIMFWKELDKALASLHEIATYLKENL